MGDLNLILTQIKFRRYKMSTKIQKIAATPLATLFEMHKKRNRVRILLSEQNDFHYEGKIAGFDEYMNLVLEEVEEILIKTKTKKVVETTILKGENILMIMQAKNI